MFTGRLIMFGPKLAIGCAPLLILLAGPISAQSIFPVRLDLDTAVQRALENDPAIKARRSATEIAEARTVEAKSAWRPSIQLSQSFARSNNPVFVFGSLLEQGRFAASNFALDTLNNPNGLNNFRSVINIRAPIFDQWQRKSRTTRAEIERKRSEYQMEAVSQGLRFEVIRSYYGAVLADELFKATDAAVRSAKENSRNTRNMVEVGMVAESDSLVADVELASMQQQRIEAESAIVITRAALNIAIGSEPNAKDELTGELREKYFPVADESELIRTALEQRPDYLRAQLVIDDAREQTRSVRNEKLPRLDASGNFGYSSYNLFRGSTDYTVGLSLSYTLFDPGRKARIDQSTAAESAAEFETNDLKNKISLDVITALQNFKTARSKIQVSIKSVAQAEEASRILQDRYHAGLSTFEAVLRAEAAVLRAKHDLLKAKYEYYVSYASILLATGRLTDVRTFD